MGETNYGGVCSKIVSRFERFLGGGEADLGGGEPQNFFRASREIFFRATRETNLGLRPPLNQFRAPLKNLQEISPPPRKNPDYALEYRPRFSLIETQQFI